jgi:hypothetical protein
LVEDENVFVISKEILGRILEFLPLKYFLIYSIAISSLYIDLAMLDLPYLFKPEDGGSTVLRNTVIHQRYT